VCDRDDVGGRVPVRVATEGSHKQVHIYGERQPQIVHGPFRIDVRTDGKVKTAQTGKSEGHGRRQQSRVRFRPRLRRISVRYYIII
jgi:hypothetical protein